MQGNIPYMDPIGSCILIIKWFGGGDNVAMVQTVYTFMAGAILVSGTVHTYVPWSKVAILGINSSHL